MGIEEGEEVQAKDIENTFEKIITENFLTSSERDGHMLYKT
jgi:hypothetical protein